MNYLCTIYIAFQKWMIHIGTHRDSGNLYKTHNFNSHKILPQRRENRHKVPNSSHLKLITSVRGKNSFLQCSDTGHVNHTTEQSPCQGVLSQYRMDSMMCVCGGGVGVWFFLVYLCF